MSSDKPGNGKAVVAGDNPILNSDQDTLGRAKSARLFARDVLLQDSSEGIVVGVYGDWGYGKTSFINMSRSHFNDAKAPVFYFNPWMFSGVEQLAESFFIELSAQLKLSPGLEKIANLIEDYGEIFMGWNKLLDIGLMVASKSIERQKGGIGERRKKVKQALKELEKPIIVVLDDIDRLSTDEIKNVFKLVRLTANFPNIIYILAFDRKRVEGALEEQGISGRAYLEKIVQVTFDLPVIPTKVLDKQIFDAIDKVFSDINIADGSFNQDIWTDIFIEIIRPLIGNMRDVYRFAAAIHGTLLDLKGRIQLADLLAVEAIRVFMPDVFYSIHQAVAGLTTVSESDPDSQEPPHLKDQIERLIEAAGDRDDIVKALITRLFPAARWHIDSFRYREEWLNIWLRERRIAHEEILRLYLERVVGTKLQVSDHAKKAMAYMSDLHAFDSYLRSVVDPSCLKDVISSLEEYQDDFSIEQVVPGVIVLLNLLPKMYEFQLGTFFDLIRPILVVQDVISPLLQLIKPPDVAARLVQEILPELNTLSAKWELIFMVGYQEGGHKLVTKPFASQLEREWRDKVRSASIDELAVEFNLFDILYLTKQYTEPREPILEIADSPEMTLALLRSVKHEDRSQSIGSHAVRRLARLNWDGLIELYGSEDIFRNRLKDLKATRLEEDPDLIELADKYLGGWRPSNFDND